MSQASPKVSVIFPMFNVEDYVANSLGTIQDQTYENLEIICVDDGSTDRTLEFIQPLLNDPRIQVIRQENRGLSGARNTGLEHATGEWITFIDSDDWVKADMIDTLLSAAVTNSYDIVSCDYIRLGLDGVRLETPSIQEFPYDRQRFARIMSGELPAQAWGRLYRKALFDGTGVRFPEGRLHEDIYTTYKLYFQAGSAGHVAAPLYSWTSRSDSISRSVSRKHVDDVLAANDDAIAFLIDNGVLSDHLNAFYRRCGHYLLGLLIRTKLMEDPGSREALHKYVTDQVRESPYFSSKLLDNLLANDRKLLDRLRRYHDFDKTARHFPRVETYFDGDTSSGGSVGQPTSTPAVAPVPWTLSRILRGIARRGRSMLKGRTGGADVR